MRFPVNFAKFLRTPFFIEHFRWLLLLDYQSCVEAFTALKGTMRSN